MATEGNEVFNSSNKPPLANQLFNLKAKPKYQRILENYAGAAFLSSYLGPTIAREPTAMEVELRTLADSPNPLINKAFAQIPMYLQHLIADTTTNYVSRPGAYDQLLVQLFDRHNPKVLFIVMNYDLLLERSLEQFGGTKFVKSADYFKGQVNLLKPHGSVNWWTALRGTQEEYNKDNIIWDKVKAGMGGDFVVRSPIPPMRSTIPPVWHMHLERVDELPQDSVNTPLFPLITAPMALKTISEFVCPPEHTDIAKDFLSTCGKYLIVGSSGWDSDLLEYLASSILPPTDIVHVVCPNNGAANEVKHRYTSGVPAFADASARDRFIVHPQEFTEYLKDFAVGNLLER